MHDFVNKHANAEATVSRVCVELLFSKKKKKLHKLLSFFHPLFSFIFVFISVLLFNGYW